MNQSKNQTFEKDFQKRLIDTIITSDGVGSMLALLSNADVQEEFSRLHLTTAINGTRLLVQQLTELLNNLSGDYDCYHIQSQNERRN